MRNGLLTKIQIDVVQANSDQSGSLATHSTLGFQKEATIFSHRTRCMICSMRAKARYQRSNDLKHRTSLATLANYFTLNTATSANRSAKRCNATS